MSRAKINQTGKWFGHGRTGGNCLLAAGLMALLLFTGSAFSESLGIRIRGLISIPSISRLPLLSGEDSTPPETAAGTDGSGIIIRAIQILTARSMMAPLAPAEPGIRTAVTKPAFGTPREVFDPARFNHWDRKHKITETDQVTHETWVLVAGLAFQYDTNLYRNPTEDDPAVGRVTDVADGSIIGWAGAEYRIGMGNGLESAIHLDLRAQRHFEESRADTASASVGAYIHDRRSWGGLMFPYTYTYWWAESGFASRASVHSLRPMVYWQAQERYRLETTAVYERRDYFDATHDAHRVGLQLAHWYTFPRPGTYLRLDNRLSNDFAGDEGYLLAEVSLSGGISIWEGLRLDGGLTYARFWFEDRPAAEIGQAGSGRFSRHDNQFRANAKLFYQFSPAFQVGLDYVLTLNDSNVEGSGGVDPYNFSKHVLTLLASGRF